MNHGEKAMLSHFEIQFRRERDEKGEICLGIFLVCIICICGFGGRDRIDRPGGTCAIWQDQH